MRSKSNDHDLALAAALQAALLPDACPATCTNQVAYARNRMCGGVGGDFYDFVRINEEQTALVIGDVVGHGVRAALLMAQIMGFLRSQAAELSRPAKIIATLNHMLLELGEKVGSVLSCSMFYSVIDSPTGVSFFVNAGHPRPLLCSRNGMAPSPLGGQNLLLGVEDFEPVEGCHTLSPGERLVLFSDGIIEAQDSASGAFGETRLHKIIRGSIRKDARGCADAVFAAVDKFRGHARQLDDETVVVIDRLQ